MSKKSISDIFQFCLDIKNILSRPILLKEIGYDGKLHQTSDTDLHQSCSHLESKYFVCAVFYTSI